MRVKDVFEGRSRWAVECADCIEFMRSLPDDSIDLVIGSPPYGKARTYGEGGASIDLGKLSEEWCAWMVDVVREASRICTGLIAINCNGTANKKRAYQHIPLSSMLEADLHRAGFNLRGACYFYRHGVFGSGGPDWFRADVERIICVTRPGKLPWSNNTACGHPPKWVPGGEPSHRNSNGTRANERVRPDRVHTKRMPDGKMMKQGYNAPVLANPGSMIHLNVGGGHMGHALAHKNEAPFPIGLPHRFIVSCCEPNGVVFDPFVGSGTTIQAASEAGRRAIGCDIRKSQVDLVRRRMRTVTGTLFNGVG